MKSSLIQSRFDTHDLCMIKYGHITETSAMGLSFQYLYYLEYVSSFSVLLLYTMFISRFLDWSLDVRSKICCRRL
jgi:hypothetical protein